MHTCLWKLNLQYEGSFSEKKKKLTVRIRSTYYEQFSSAYEIIIIIMNKYYGSQFNNLCLFELSLLIRSLYITNTTLLPRMFRIKEPYCYLKNC